MPGLRGAGGPAGAVLRMVRRQARVRRRRAGADRRDLPGMRLPGRDAVLAMSSMPRPAADSLPGLRDLISGAPELRPLRAPFHVLRQGPARAQSRLSPSTAGAD